jgi:hypothetical protein
MTSTCVNCDRPAIARGLCNNHYQQAWRRGMDPLGPRPRYGKYNKRDVIDNGDGTASVPLTKGYTALIDTGDIPLVCPYSWHARTTASGSVYAATRLRDEGQTFVYLHRLLTSAPRDMEVDHINRDTLNNRRENLRVCDASLNAVNKRKQRNGKSSRFKGVFWDTRRGLWRSEFRYKNVKKQGRFSTERDAAIFYNASVIAVFGVKGAPFLNDV